MKVFKKGKKIRLSENFTLQEFDCQCELDSCYYTFIQMELLENLELTRLEFKKPIIVTCGNRCARHNENLKKMFKEVATRSSHIIGDAADITCQDLKDLDQLEKIAKKHFNKIIRYKTHLHVDNRLLKE